MLRRNTAAFWTDGLATAVAVTVRKNVALF
jgi:hypothetical protein